MSEGKNILFKVEVLVILVLFISFLVWAASKCKGVQLQEMETAMEVDSSQLVEEDTVEAKPPPPKPPEVEKVTPLYVTINGMNMRRGPSLDSPIILKLKLYEEVYFLNEVTDSTLEINLGYETVNEPWIKVKHSKGHEGWVYGAGVHYYKMKHPGFME